MLLLFVVTYYLGLQSHYLMIPFMCVLFGVLVYYCKLVLDEARPRREPRDNEAWVREVVERVWRRCNCLGNAKVLIWESDNIGAYVELARPDMVTVTRGALERLTREELEAVLAHECGHLFYRVDVLLLAFPLMAFLFPIVFLPLDIGLACLEVLSPRGYS